MQYLDGAAIALLTAAFTLANTIILAWQGRRIHQVSKATNGMQLQLLAEAEARGRRSGRASSRAEILSDDLVARQTEQLVAVDLSKGTGDRAGDED